MLRQKVSCGAIWVLVPAIILISCGGGGSSGTSGIINNPDCSLPDTPGVSGLISWPFINPGDYIYDAAKVLISDGTASLVLVDQTD
ncbi:MAG: hypothetical protein C4526_04055, partial [Nitrospiraceae bacterium]